MSDAAKKRPGDHPEFFRFPAPEGRSRESTIVLDGEGRFFHDGELVEHPGLRDAFHQWIARHPDDGRFILTNGWDWTYFTVEDAPLFVRAVRPDGVVSLSNGKEEPLDPTKLVEGEGGILYLATSLGLEAKFTRTAQAGLAPFLVETADGPGIRVGGVTAVPGARGRGAA